MRNALSMSTATIIVGIGASMPSMAIATRWSPSSGNASTKKTKSTSSGRVSMFIS